MWYRPLTCDNQPPKAIASNEPRITANVASATMYWVSLKAKLVMSKETVKPIPARPLMAKKSSASRSNRSGLAAILFANIASTVIPMTLPIGKATAMPTNTLENAPSKTGRAIATAKNA